MLSTRDRSTASRFIAGEMCRGTIVDRDKLGVHRDALVKALRRNHFEIPPTLTITEETTVGELLNALFKAPLEQRLA